MMDTLFAAYAAWFTAPALLGTGFLLIQMILGELGGDGALDLDLDVDINAEHPGAEFTVGSASRPTDSSIWVSPAPPSSVSRRALGSLGS
jgi:hypothetical protein